MRRVAPFLVSAIVGLTLACPRAARAADDVVVVLLENDDAKASEIETLDAIRAQAGDLPVTVVRQRHARFRDLRAQMDLAAEVASSRKARGVFWVDTDASGDTLLFLLDADGSRLLLRRIRHEAEGEAVTEEVANVAHGIVEALAEGRRVGMTSVSVAPAPTPPRRANAAPPPAPRAKERLAGAALEAGWTGETWGERAPWVDGTTIGAEATFAHVVVHARYTFFYPATIADAGTVIRLTRHAVDVAAGWQARLGTISLAAELGLVLDPVSRTTVRVAPGLAAGGDAVALTFGLSPRGRVAWTLLPRIALYTDVGVDVFFAQTSYTIDAATIFSPNPARLRVDAGLVFTVF